MRSAASSRVLPRAGGWEGEGGEAGGFVGAYDRSLGVGLERLLLAVEVVVNRPEADIALLGDLGVARRAPGALGDQPRGGGEEGLRGAGFTPAQPRPPRRAGCRYRLCHHSS